MSFTIGSRNRPYSSMTFIPVGGEKEKNPGLKRSFSSQSVKRNLVSPPIVL